MIRDRLLQIAEYKGFSVRNFEEFCGLKRGNISNMSNISEIGSEKLSKIIDRNSEISPYWLITGRGEMIQNAPKTNQNVQEISHTHPPKITMQPAECPCKDTKNIPIGIPLVPMEALAGLPAIDNIGINFLDCDHYVVPEFIDKGAEYLIRVSGSSMYPKYSNGDVLACKRLTDILFFQWGKVYVIDSSQGALVKRIFEDPNNSDNIILVSDNKDRYPPFSFPKSDIRSLSVVIGVVKLE